MGIFGKPLKRAIWNTLGLHAVLTTCLRFLSHSDGACVACCLFFQQAAAMSSYKFTPRAAASPDAPAGRLDLGGTQCICSPILGMYG